MDRLRLPDRRNLVPKPSEACFVPGKKGSGKSTTIRLLMSYYAQSYPVIVIDTKPSEIYRYWGAIETDEDEALYTIDHYPRVVYRPRVSIDELPYAIDSFYSRLFDRVNSARRRPLGIVTDETHHVMPGVNPGPGATQLLTQGRELGIMTVWGTQRPARIPLWIYTEADRFYIHRLIGVNDRKNLSQTVGFEVYPVPRFRFIYYHDGEDRDPLEWGFDIQSADAAA
jgi:energy-coupling factor transporter ATP-binding protein EcfA2